MNRLFFLSLAFLAMACSQRNRPVELKELELSDLIVDTLFLEKDTLTQYLGVNFTHFQTDSGEVLMTFNQHRLLTYSYPEGKILKSVKYEIEGPDGIGGFIPGSFIDQDKIYILTQDQKLLEADLEGKIIRRIPLPEVPTQRLAKNYTTFPFSPMFKSEKGLFIPDVPLVLKESLLTYKNWILDFSLSDSTFTHVRFTFPSSAKNFLDDSELGQYFHHFDPAENAHWISFSSSDSVLKIKEDQSEWILENSEHPLQFLRGTTSERGEWTAFHPNPESSKYTSIQQDPESGLLFRHVRIQVGNPDQNIGSKHALLFFNRKGEKIAEVKFTDHEFGSLVFHTSKGIYIPIVAQLWEDQVPYARLDLSKINP
jgi:hypothetical protein